MITQIRYSLTFRLALMFSLSAFFVLLLLGFTVLYVINQHFIDQDKMMLENQSQQIYHELHNINQIDLIVPKLQTAMANNAHNEHGFTLLVLDKANKILFNNSPNIQDISPFIVAITKQQPDTIDLVDNSYRVISQQVTRDDQTATIIIALNINHHQLFLDTFKYSMWIAIAIATLLMGLLACLVAKRGLKPLHILMSQTEQITANNLSQPLPTNHLYLEIAQLTTTFNAMLDRLNHSFQRLIGFSSDLAHELRTPLSTMKMQNQVILSRPRSVSEYQQVLHDNAQILDQMSRMVTDMLFLAKSDNGMIIPNANPIDLVTEFQSLFDFYDYLTQEKQMILRLTGHGKLNGDKSLLKRALSNLIINAINYGDEDSIIDITIIDQSDSVQITIKNQGKTIDPKHLPHLFERFYRAETARTYNGDGSGLGLGLGLAITASIIQVHKGDISVTSTQNQTCFRLVFNKY